MRSAILTVFPVAILCLACPSWLSQARHAQAQAPRENQPPGGLLPAAGGGDDLERDASELTKVFTIVHGDASELANLLKQLYGSEGVTIASDQRTNSLIVRGRKAALSEIEALVLRLDEQAKRSPRAKNINAERPLKSVLDASGNLSIPTATLAATNKVNELRSTYREAERVTLETAPKLRAAKAGSAERARLESQLKREVKAAFDVRQELQRVEVAALKQRVAKIEQTLSRRQQLRDKIVEKRIAQLIEDKDLHWDPTSHSWPGKTSAGSPMGLPGPARAPRSDSSSTDLPSGSKVDEFIRLQQDLLNVNAQISKLKIELASRKPGVDQRLLEIELVRSEKERAILEVALQTKIEWLQNEIEQAEVESAHAKAELERITRLVDRQLVPGTELAKSKLKSQQCTSRCERLKSLYQLYHRSAADETD